MNRTHKLTLGLALVAGAAFAAASGAASSPSASASASASAAPLPLLSGADIALPLFVALAWWAGRGKAALSGKDWLGVTLVAGEPKDVRVWVSGDPFDWEKSEAERKSVALADLPLRRGQSYVVTFLKPDWLYEGATTGEADTFHVIWREGAADPIVLVSGPGTVHSF